MSTEGNRPVKALTSSGQELRLLVETSPALVWSAGPEGNIEYVNKRVLEYLGKPLPRSLVRMDGKRPDDVAFKVSSWFRNLETKNPHDAACKFRGAVGRYRWFEVRGEPLRAGDGTVLCWYGILIDIEDREKLQATLK
jgi:PAS domain-containing protein